MLRWVTKRKLHPLTKRFWMNLPLYVLTTMRRCSAKGRSGCSTTSTGTLTKKPLILKLNLTTHVNNCKPKARLTLIPTPVQIN